ncbi:DUF1772 domain-containing protein [Hyphomicrobium sp. CS1GBMeth3]|uniref:DUF1772 domain-containing protein n=1 Tax=Hyphomicrobium sp. CS1GBMeth3 TaxID=1892845 RepID=UPI0009301D6A|nr:DUF1772 domain-containing protein [Hyphomicrobium sp. CS1GBMeth3]
MYIALEVLAVMLAAVTMSLALAHALELPGKLRLDREQYLTVQTIYYPGFTLGGIAEVASIVAVLALWIASPANTPQFWLIAAALAALSTVQAIFWIMTQPINKYWLQNVHMSRAAERFFETRGEMRADNWTVMRDRWERSHVLRAIAAGTALLCLTLAVAL